MDSSDAQRVEDIIRPVLEKMTASIAKKKPENVGIKKLYYRHCI